MPLVASYQLTKALQMYLTWESGVRRRTFLRHLALQDLVDTLCKDRKLR